MRLLVVLAFAVLLAACNPRGAGNHENVGNNGEGLELYADNGYDLSVEWPVAFNVMVDGDENATGLANALAGKGYDVEVVDADGGIRVVWAWKDFVPTLATMDATEREVVAASDRFGGYYGGWELDEDAKAQAEAAAAIEEEE